MSLRCYRIKLVKGRNQCNFKCCMLHVVCGMWHVVDLLFMRLNNFVSEYRWNAIERASNNANERLWWDNFFNEPKLLQVVKNGAPWGDMAGDKVDEDVHTYTHTHIHAYLFSSSALAAYVHIWLGTLCGMWHAACHTSRNDKRAENALTIVIIKTNNNNNSNNKQTNKK